MADLTRASRVPGGRLDLPIGKPHRAIRVARLHSGFVRYLRHFIIFGCSFAVLALGIIILFDPFKRLPRNLSVSQVGLQGSVVTLQTPKTEGFRADGQPFELAGVSGTQDILNPHVLNLVGVDAKVGLDDATTAKITARTGIYDSSQDVIWLRTDVRIKNDVSGYDMRLRSATVDLNSSALVTEEPVVVSMDDGSTISADRMDITDGGHKISFQGEVKSAVVMGDADADPGTNPDEAAK
jgi:lipopolysaccharide export system protein LptC